MKAIGIIPARYDSTRFPGKPLAVIAGKTMIQRVYEQALKCQGLDPVIVATDNEVILKHVEGFGGKVMMTSDRHRSGTERCAEVVRNLLYSGDQADQSCIINIQGDEPFIDPEQISQVIRCFDDPDVMIATLIKAVHDDKILNDPNVVKVVTARDGNAIYFSRAPIPFVRGAGPSNLAASATYYRHIGLYGYRGDTLMQLVDLPETPLEKAESLEQLRWLEYGYRIRTGITEYESISIDTPEDLLKITNTIQGI
jgi:3-deoxy-manno-octulosonate cytidylyltransferase (CMP-KDO synthetase)